MAYLTTLPILTVEANANIVGTLTSNTVTTSGNSNLGPVANVTITGGSNNQALTTDGTGNLRWQTPISEYYDTFSDTGIVTTSSAVARVFVAGDQTATFPNGSKIEFVGDPNGTVVYTTSGITTDGVNTQFSITPSAAIAIPTGTDILLATVTAYTQIKAGSNVTMSVDGSVLTVNATGGGGSGGSNIANGNSTVNIATANGNITMSAGGSANLTLDTTGNTTIPGRLFGQNGNYNQPNFIQPNPGDNNWSFGTYNDGGPNFWIGPAFYGQNETTRGFRVWDNSANGDTGASLFQVDGTGNATLTGSLNMTSGQSLVLDSATGNAFIAQTMGLQIGGEGGINFAINDGAGNTTTAGFDTGANFTTPGNVTANLVTANTVTAGGFTTTGSGGNIYGANVITANTLVATVSANLGNVSNLNITGGSNGQFLSTDGNGNLSFANAGSSTSAAGANGQIQYNLNNAFTASANLFFDGNNLAVGGTTTPFGTIDVYGANTSITNGLTNGQLTIGAYQGAAAVTTVQGAEYINFVTYTGTFNENMRILNSGAISFGGTGINYGTAGQVLTSNGVNAPTWSDAYGDGNVVTLLGAFGSNGITTSGTILLAR